MSRGWGIFSLPSLLCVLSAIVEHAVEFFLLLSFCSTGDGTLGHALARDMCHHELDLEPPSYFSL